MYTCNSKDYKNDWYNTWEFNILMIRKFIKEVGPATDIGQGKITGKKKIGKYLFSKNYKALESIILSDSLQKLESYDNYTRKDADNVLAYFKRKLENNEEDDFDGMFNFEQDAGYTNNNINLSSSSLLSSSTTSPISKGRAATIKRLSICSSKPYRLTHNLSRHM